MHENNVISAAIEHNAYIFVLDPFYLHCTKEVLCFLMASLDDLFSVESGVFPYLYFCFSC